MNHKKIKFRAILCPLCVSMCLFVPLNTNVTKRVKRPILVPFLGYLFLPVSH